MRQFLRGLVLGLVLSGCGPGAVGPDASVPAAAAGCGKDTDCKGTRICLQGQCAFPEQAAPSMTAQGGPPASEATSSTLPVPPTTEPTANNATGGVEPPDKPPQRLPSADVSSGERPPLRCGCAPTDLMCAMKCAQRGNAAGPSTFPDNADRKTCGCAQHDR